MSDRLALTNAIEDTTKGEAPHTLRDVADRDASNREDGP
jgi:hypothetical protein